MCRASTAAPDHFSVQAIDSLPGGMFGSAGVPTCAEYTGDGLTGRLWNTTSCTAAPLTHREDGCMVGRAETWREKAGRLQAAEARAVAQQLKKAAVSPSLAGARPP
jgi:hypothetical protein